MVAAATGGILLDLSEVPDTSAVRPQRGHTRRPAPAASAPAAPAFRASTDDCTPADPVDAPFGPEDREFLGWVEWKYEHLLADVQLERCARVQLEVLLAARERLARERGAGDPVVGELDRQVGLWIPAHLADYEALRRSDAERLRLDDYARGIQHVAPLGEEQKRRTLRAMLERRRELDTALRDAGVERPSLSTDERRRAHEVVDSALDLYRDEFLLDASEFLDEEQLALLRNYETTELEREREQLEIAINMK